MPAGLTSGLLGSSPQEVRGFYLATAPDLFGVIAAKLAAHALVTPTARIIVEKPIGIDGASAETINDQLGAVFSERQIFRIDHYLGKETVQNLLALRFANILLEPLWNANYIDHVQITVAEAARRRRGRGGYYDRVGALRDMVQNHLLQLLCLVAMEPPASLDADAVRDEKLTTLLRRAGADRRGQCRDSSPCAASIGPAPATAARVPAHLDDPEPPESTTETSVALKATIANWRWAARRSICRTGKRLHEQRAGDRGGVRRVPHLPRSRASAA